jgi:hypothetical protein
MLIAPARPINVRDMADRGDIRRAAGRIIVSVALCYAIVLQALFGSLAFSASSSQGAYLTVLCHPGADDTGAPGQDVPVKHHCVLCHTGAVVAALATPETERLLPPERAAEDAFYLRRQDPAAVPLHLPARVSRGPPMTA